jgi:hypothetical protein
MRRILLSCLAAAFIVGGASAAYAGPTSGTTTLEGVAVAGQPLTIDVTLRGVYPVVPYEFILTNQCWFSGRFAGHYDSLETWPLLGPWYDDNGGSRSTETINLNDIPSGAVCKVSITHSSSPVKGSTTSYAVS